MFLDFYVAAFCNLGFAICGSCMEQVWPPLVWSIWWTFSRLFLDANPMQALVEQPGCTSSNQNFIQEKCWMSHINITA